MAAKSSVSKHLEFFSLIGQLKRVRRTGWVRKHVTDPESVADHMYRMAVMAFLVKPDSGLDKDKCIKMCLVHDMAECIVGDITPFDGVAKQDKHKREETAVKYICSLVDSSVGSEIYDLWQEYETMSSKEAMFVKDLDKYDMIQQAHEYEQLDGKSLQEFFDSTEGQFNTDQVKSWVEDLQQVRNTSTNKDSG
ncbi:hypothetical protein SNE40_022111 [Patella caerulea]|uniref:5'-deoxynucleotidase HDDC2 n=1 Tax=Patella caerulea TaxID=87958 RepID=A0AAN8J4F6_PATCE